MKNIILLLALSATFTSIAATDWKNPAVVCPEKALAQGLTCLDLSGVANPILEFPGDLSADEVELWKTDRAADLKVCRGREVLAREAAKPGSFTPLQIQISFMNAGSGINAQDKLLKIRQAAATVDMPVHALIGALTQESLLSDLGISPDGGNYSCGIGQLNVSEWCLGMQKLSATERSALGWPSLKCESNLVTPKMVAPFYAIAETRLNGRPAYQIRAEDFAGITLAQVVNSFPAATPAIQQTRFQALTSFIRHCQNHSLGIPIKAQNLRKIFDSYVPAKMRNAETYAGSDTFARQCQESYKSKFYPLHTGWLLTLAMYNAGPSMAKLLEHYYQKPAEALPAMTPKDLIEALHWGGEYRSADGRIHYQGANGRTYSQTWTKSCVVQRHVARVIQHVTAPGKTLASSLEEMPCAQGISETRRTSSGVK